MEYAVLKDLDSTITGGTDLEEANAALKVQNQDLVQQLALARGSALRLQEENMTLKSERKHLANNVEQ